MADTTTKRRRRRPKTEGERYREWIINHPRQVLTGVLIASFWVGLLPLLLTLAAALYQGRPATVMRPSDFGSMYGFVAALASGLALGALVLAVAMQSEELSLQRRELKMTRAELKRQAKAQEETARIGIVATYLSVVSSSLNYHTTPPDQSGHDRQRKAQELNARLESLMDVLLSHVQASVPIASVRPVLDDFETALIRVGDILNHPIPGAPPYNVIPNISIVTDMADTFEKYVNHLTWHTQTERIRRLRLGTDMVKQALRDFLKRMHDVRPLVYYLNPKNTGHHLMGAKPTAPEEAAAKLDERIPELRQSYECLRRYYDEFRAMTPSELDKREDDLDDES